MSHHLLDEALEIIIALGFPKGQRNERSALSLLSLLNLTPGKSWENSESPLMGITPMMGFMSKHYGKAYAANTREAVRRRTIHQFVDAALVLRNPDDLARPTNSELTVYQIEPDALALIKTFKTSAWPDRLAAYLSVQQTLVAKYAQERDLQKIPIQIAEGKEIQVSPGPHSLLIKAIIEEFAPRFVPGAVLIYAGDTGEKMGYFDKDLLSDLGVTVDAHGKMPDAVLHYPAKDWLILVESVTSHGPVDGKRHGELAHLFKNAKPGIVYVTAFPSRAIMARYLTEISWETEVWVSEAPTHLIHFNGERFLGPYANVK